jgi:hypothetical protein
MVSTPRVFRPVDARIGADIEETRLPSAVMPVDLVTTWTGRGVVISVVAARNSGMEAGEGLLLLANKNRSIFYNISLVVPKFGIEWCSGT